MCEYTYVKNEVSDELEQELVSDLSESAVKRTPEETLSTHGYLLLERPFEISRVHHSHERVREAFAPMAPSEDDIHTTLYEFNDEETDSDPHFYERGKIATPRMDYKGRSGYRQFMMSLESSTLIAQLWASGKQYEWKETHGPEAIKDAEQAFLSILELFSGQAMEPIFAPAPESLGSYCGFLLNDSAPFSVCFGYHYELHQDRHENAIVISVQLSPTPTPWKIGRNLDALDTVVQDQGAMMVMEAMDYDQRISPWHMPCIGEMPRNAAVVVFAGIYRERFMSWLTDHASACGFTP